MLCNESITSEGLTLVISPCEISSMETKQIRLERFREIWRSQFNGNIAALARALGSSANQVRFYLNPDKPGGRWMGEDFARDIERILNLPRNYLDDASDSMTPADVAAAFENGSAGKQEALTLLAKLPDGEAETILPLIRSILSKYE